MNRMKTVIGVFALPLAATALVGCGSAPTAEIEAADRTLEQARSVQATEYAPESWQAAEDARAALETELAAQDERFAPLRSYGTATELAAAAKSAAETAERDAIEGRNRARDEAAALITDVRASLVNVETLLAQAPRGKGTEFDLAALRADVTGIEVALVELDGDFAAERYAESRVEAHAALESAKRIEDEIRRAMESTARRPTHRG